MSTWDALAAIPEPEGVTLYRMPPVSLWEEPGGLTVGVVIATGTAGLEGGYECRWEPLQVPLDVAHDLSRQGPRAYLWPETGGLRGVTRWRIDVLGFIEQEAQDAFYAVCAAIDGAC